MSKRKFILLYICVVALLLGACAEVAQPAGLLPQEAMVPVLADLEMVYAGIDQTIKNPKERPGKYVEMNAIVFKKHHVDPEQFYNSYQWYESDPVKLDTLFRQVASYLNDELQSMQAGGGRVTMPTNPPKLNQ